MCLLSISRVIGSSVLFIACMQAQSQPTVVAIGEYPADFGTPVVNAVGQVAFYAAHWDSSGGSSSAVGIWRASNSDPVTIASIAMVGDAAPADSDFPSGLLTFGAFDRYPSINAAGDVAFRATVWWQEDEKSPVSEQYDGIFVSLGGTLHRVAKEGQVAPGTGGEHFFDLFADPTDMNHHRVLLSETSRIVFMSQTDSISPNNREGLWGWTLGGGLELHMLQYELPPEDPLNAVAQVEAIRGFDLAADTIAIVAWCVPGDLCECSMECDHSCDYSALWMGEPGSMARVVTGQLDGTGIQAVFAGPFLNGTGTAMLRTNEMDPGSMSSGRRTTHSAFDGSLLGIVVGHTDAPDTPGSTDCVQFQTWGNNVPMPAVLASAVNDGAQTLTWENLTAKDGCTPSGDQPSAGLWYWDGSTLSGVLRIESDTDVWGDPASSTRYFTGMLSHQTFALNNAKQLAAMMDVDTSDAAIIARGSDESTPYWVLGTGETLVIDSTSMDVYSLQLGSDINNQANPGNIRSGYGVLGECGDIIWRTLMQAAGPTYFNAILKYHIPEAICDPPCNLDVTCDGNADSSDVACFTAAVSGDPGCLCDPEMDLDFNHDGNVDQDDVAAFINAIAGGGCP